MIDRRKHRVLSYGLVFGLLLSALPITSAAAQVPVKENIGYYDITPDLCPSGTEEELDNVTFHQVKIPVELKSTGIIISLPVPGKGRVHYNLGLDPVDSAATIKSEVYEDAKGSVPVKNNDESNKVYHYSYNFDTERKGTYYVKLTAPDYTGDEDLSISFSAQFYDGEDRILTEGVQAYDQMNSKEQQEVVPKTGEAHNARIYYGLAALCLCLLIIIRIKDAGNTDTYYL